MGWLYGWKTRAELVKHLTEENGTRMIAHKTTSDNGESVLWIVAPVRADFPDENMRGKNVILCCLMQVSGGLHGYKDMDESAHPYYYSCPLSFLSMTVELCPEWRAKVHQFHGDTAARSLKLRMLQVGEVVKLKDGCRPPEVRITQVKPKLMGEYNGTVYRVTPRFLAL